MLVIVDGYNVLRSSGPTAQLKGESLRVERERFISRLRKYQSGRQDKIIVIFDGTQADTNQPTTQSLGDMSVIFSRRGQTADEVIKGMVEQNTSPQDIIVVSSDRDVVNFVRSMGASVTGARSLADKLELLNDTTRYQKEIDNFNHYEYSVKGYIRETTSPKHRKGNPRRSKRQRQRLQLWSLPDKD